MSTDPVPKWLVRRDELIFRHTGTVTNYSCVADSGNTTHRRFCPSCGTPLISEAEVRPHRIFVRAGTLDNPEFAKPAATIWISQAASWACLDPNLPYIVAQPPPAR